MKRRNKIWIAIIIALVLACAVVWETVPYVRYILIPVTGGTQAPTSLTRASNDSSKPRYRYADYPPVPVQHGTGMHIKESS